MPEPVKPLPIEDFRPLELSSLLTNPALTARFKKQTIETNFKIGLINQLSTSILYSNPKKKIASGVFYFNAGRANLYWIENGIEKSENVTLEEDLLIFFSYGSLYERNDYFGINLKFAHSKIAYWSANAIAVDAGFSFSEKNSKLSLSINNLGVANAFIEKRDTLPLFFRIGYSSQNRTKRLLTGFDINYMPEGTRFFVNIGAMYKLKTVNIFAGYRFEYKSRKFFEPIGALGFGFELRKKFNLCYSISPFSPLSIIHRLSFSYPI